MRNDLARYQRLWAIEERHWGCPKPHTCHQPHLAALAGMADKRFASARCRQLGGAMLANRPQRRRFLSRQNEFVANKTATNPILGKDLCFCRQKSKCIENTTMRQIGPNAIARSHRPAKPRQKVATHPGYLSRQSPSVALKKALNLLPERILRSVAKNRKPPERDRSAAPRQRQTPLGRPPAPPAASAPPRKMRFQAIPSNFAGLARRSFLLGNLCGL
jgi:hypothetical protein